eukprot:COSAG01_NODE_22732_length_843_cov_4.701613_1_plen_64_part_01
MGLRSAATTARGERSLQKRMGGCRVNKLCVHIGFFAMSLAPPPATSPLASSESRGSIGGEGRAH